MSTDLSEFEDSFFEEAAEHVAAMETELLVLEEQPENPEPLQRVFRAAHTIKGGSGMFGFTAVVDFTHRMEALLDELRNARIGVTKAIIDLLLEATDGVKGLLHAAQRKEFLDAHHLHDVTTRLEAYLTGAIETGSPDSPVVLEAEEERVASKTALPLIYDIAWTPPADLFRRGLDPLPLLRELAGLGAIRHIEVDASRLPDLTQLDPETCYLSWTLQLETAHPLAEIEAVFEFVRDEGHLTICARAVAASDAAVADATQAPQRLGEILVEEGVISTETLTATLAQQKPLGALLVEQGVAQPAQIDQALQKQTQQSAAASASRPEAASIRVETPKIDKVINLVGELVITQAMISDLGTDFDMRNVSVLQERIAQLEQNTRELQDHVMSIRMMPIGTVFHRFPRLVRDLAATTHKKIKLLLSGEETELDKTVVESIGDPLTHLIRNAVDHAIEAPDERVAAGKPEQGTVRLNAYHQGGNVLIEIHDDGKGLDRDRILAKARRNGLLAETETPPDDQIWPLIFEPGFSTAEQVTDVSGRGVGMDVVKRNIKALGGTVSITTEAGTGTTFTLKLPLTLAIIEGLTVRVGAEIYIVPLLSVLESIRPQRSWLKTVVGRGEIVDLRGDIVPIARLYQLLCCTPDVTDPVQGLLIVVESDGQHGAILVDEILGQQQVVIKSLEQNFRKIDGIAGATILGSGQAAFILDVRGLLDLAKQGGYELSAQLPHTGGRDACEEDGNTGALSTEEARDALCVGAET